MYSWTVLVLSMILEVHINLGHGQVAVSSSFGENRSFDLTRGTARDSNIRNPNRTFDKGEIVSRRFLPDLAIGQPQLARALNGANKDWHGLPAAKRRDCGVCGIAMAQPGQVPK